MPGPLAVRRAICQVCRRLYDRGLIAGRDGTVSVRIAPDRILATPAGISKADVTPDDLVEVSLADGGRRRGTRPVSTEIAVLLRAYRRRLDVMAVVHAHPPVATGFAAAGQSLPANALPEIILQMGTVALVPYDTPGTEALADRFEPFLAGHDAFLMASHGALTLGATLEMAHQRMESVEHAARILLAARLLGGVMELTPAQVDRLLTLRTGPGIAGPRRASTPDDLRRTE
jgi:L-fuculose-phosphate aldolase